MGAYRCSTCGVNYSSADPCRVCGGAVWWSNSSFPSEPEIANAALQAKVKDTEWADPVDKIINWRFEQLFKAGYDLRQAEELAADRRLDLHAACALASEYGAQTAYLRFF